MTESLERGSMRTLARRFGIDKVTVMRIVHRVAERLPGSLEVARRLKPSWSGTLVFDGKYVRVFDRWAKVSGAAARAKARPGVATGDTPRPMPRHRCAWLCGIDHGTRDLPHYAIAEEETKVDLVLYFQGLQRIGYPLRVLVSDGNPDIPAAARHVFGDTFVHQRCTKHFVEGLLRLLADEDPKRAADTERLIRLIQNIITAPDLEAAGRRMAVLPHVAQDTLVQRQVIGLFEAAKESLAAHLLYPELRIPSTSNDIENVFRQVSLRLKSLGQFRCWQNAGHYLKSWALFRRLTPFTDSRGGRKAQNGKAPLELAGVDLSHVDMYSI
jgi:hypothetical protein